MASLRSSTAPVPSSSMLIQQKFPRSIESEFLQPKYKYRVYVCVYTAHFKFPTNFRETQVRESEQNIFKDVPMRLVATLPDHTLKTNQVIIYITETNTMLMFIHIHTSMLCVPQCPADDPPGFWAPTTACWLHGSTSDNTQSLHLTTTARYVGSKRRSE